MLGLLALSGPSDEFPIAQIGFFAFMPSGAMLAVFAWRAKGDVMMSTGVVVATGWLPIMAFVVMVLWAQYAPPPPPSIADMVEDPALIDCVVLRPAADSARIDMYDRLNSVDEIRYYKKVYLAYVDNCMRSAP